MLIKEDLKAYLIYLRANKKIVSCKKFVLLLTKKYFIDEQKAHELYHEYKRGLQ